MRGRHGGRECGRVCALYVACVGVSMVSQAFPVRATPRQRRHREGATRNLTAALPAVAAAPATTPQPSGAKVATVVAVSTAGMSCAILQTGLLDWWIVDSTLEMVVSANPQLPFRYVGLFQTTAPAKGRFSEAMTNTYQNVSRATASTLAALDAGWRSMRRVRNLQVDFLGVDKNPSVPAPKGFTGRLLTFDSDYRQLRLLSLGAGLVSPSTSHLLRLREDAGWYAPFSLPLVSSTILFKDCFGWSKSTTLRNDKMWFGPAKHVIKLQKLYFEAFLHPGRAKRDWSGSTEDALSLAVHNVGLPERRVDFPASDARRDTRLPAGYPAGGLCWKENYLCGAVAAGKVQAEKLAEKAKARPGAKAKKKRGRRRKFYMPPAERAPALSGPANDSVRLIKCEASLGYFKPASKRRSELG